MSTETATEVDAADPDTDTDAGTGTGTGNAAGTGGTAPARTGRRVPAGVSLAALSLGGLAIGTTEFASMGVLPGFAAGLGVSVPTAGIAISAYALGVVIGAPVIALAAARWPRRRLVLVLAVALAVTNASSALAPTFGSFVATRFLSGLPHGAYFGTAAVLGAALVPAARRPRAIASVMMGLMVANIVGVPAATFLGETWGWRTAYLAVAAIAVVTVVGVIALVPDVRVGTGSLRGELSAFARPQVWLTLGVIAVGFGGTFTVYSYISPILTSQTGLGSAAVPLVLAVFGLGMTLGNLAGGRLAERWNLPVIAVAMLAGSAVLFAFTVTAGSLVPAVVTLFLLGFVIIAATPALTTRLIDAAPDGPSLAAATYHSAFNVANALGAALGGFVLSAGLGWSAPAAAGGFLPLLGLGVLALSVLVARRTRAS